MTRQFAALVLTVTCLTTDSRPASASAENQWGSPELKRLADNSFKLWSQHRLEETAQHMRRGYNEALRHERPRAALWFLTGLGNANFRLGNYRQTLDAYLSARDLALHSSLPTEAAVALINLSSLYMHVFDSEAALAAAEESHRLLPRKADPRERTQILVQLGRVLLVRGEASRAMPYFERAIEFAARRGEALYEALAWDQMGLELIRLGELERAETALNNALRLRTSKRDPNVFVTEYKLALLHLAKGDAVRARERIDASFARPQQDRVQLPLHHMYLTRARIRRAQGDLEGSLDDFIKAAESAEDWRSRGLFADSFRLTADEGLDEIYDEAVAGAVILYQKTGHRRYAELGWELCERNRALSLRETMTRDRSWTQRLPGEYWRALDALRELESQSFGSGRLLDSGADEAVRLRMQLAEMEARVPNCDSTPNLRPANAVDRRIERGGCETLEDRPENFSHRISLKDFQRVLGRSGTLITFRLAETASYRWVLTDKELNLTLLPNRRELKTGVDRLRAALSEGSADAMSRAHMLYSDLFVGLADADASRWYVELDDELLEMPVASLVSRIEGGRPVYLLEHRLLQVVPGAWAIESNDVGTAANRFLGLGDGVYNTADPRYVAVRDARRNWASILPALVAGKPNVLELPRLFGSRQEVMQASTLYGGDRTVLTGSELNRKRLSAELSKRPEVIHIASHFVVDKNEARNSSIVLGCRPDGAGHPRLELLTAREIASFEVPGAVVVLSGCSSAAGRPIPAAGVQGLARAWLAAGAGAVIATHWPVPDDSGAMFSGFYRHLRDLQGSDKLAPAEALRRAQVDMLRSGTWRSEPNYWAAYQIIGRSH